MNMLESHSNITLLNFSGSSCEWLNVTGTCVDIRRCESLQYDSQEYGPPPVRIRIIVI